MSQHFHVKGVLLISALWKWVEVSMNKWSDKIYWPYVMSDMVMPTRVAQLYCETDGHPQENLGSIRLYYKVNNMSDNQFKRYWSRRIMV